MNGSRSLFLRIHPTNAGFPWPRSPAYDPGGVELDRFHIHQRQAGLQTTAMGIAGCSGGSWSSPGKTWPQPPVASTVALAEKRPRTLPASP